MSPDSDVLTEHRKYEELANTINHITVLYK